MQQAQQDTLVLRVPSQTNMPKYQGYIGQYQQVIDNLFYMKAINILSDEDGFYYANWTLYIPSDQDGFYKANELEKQTIAGWATACHDSKSAKNPNGVELVHY